MYLFGLSFQFFLGLIVNSSCDTAGAKVVFAYLFGFSYWFRLLVSLARIARKVAHLLGRFMNVEKSVPHFCHYHCSCLHFE